MTAATTGPSSNSTARAGTDHVSKARANERSSSGGADVAPRTTDPQELSAAVRRALGRAITQQIFGQAVELPVIALDPELEKVLGQAFTGGEGAALEPGLAETLLRESAQAAKHQETLGQPQVLLVPDRLRAPLARMLKRVLPQLRVLAHAEIPDSRTIRVSSIVGART